MSLIETLTYGYLAVYGGYPDGSTKAEYYPNKETLDIEREKYKSIRHVAFILKIDPSLLEEVEEDFRAK